MKSIQVLFLPSCSVLKAAKIVVIPARVARIAKCNNWPPVTFAWRPSGLQRPTGVRRERVRKNDMTETFYAVSISIWRDECGNYGAMKDTCTRRSAGAAVDLRERKKTKTKLKNNKKVPSPKYEQMHLLPCQWFHSFIWTPDALCLHCLQIKINNTVRWRHLKLCRNGDLEKRHFKFERTCRVPIREWMQIFGVFPRQSRRKAAQQRGEVWQLAEGVKLFLERRFWRGFSHCAVCDSRHPPKLLAHCVAASIFCPQPPRPCEQKPSCWLGRTAMYLGDVREFCMGAARQTVGSISIGEGCTFPGKKKKKPQAARHYGSASFLLPFKKGEVNGVEVGRLESN